MKIGKSEEKIAKYYYLKGFNDVANISVLTNQRLVVVYGKTEDS